jgi:RNA polymerase sigma-70 factor, ECF subfamily
MDLKNLDDSSLIKLCGQQPDNKRCIIELLQRFGPIIMQTITWTLRRFSQKAAEEKEDVFQDVFTSLFEHDCMRLKNFDPLKAGFTTYIMTIAKHKAINHLRKSGRCAIDLPDSIEDQVPGNDSIVENNELMGKIHTLLPSLSPGERLFYHFYFEEYTPPETIARILGISIDSVYSKKAKLIEKLKIKMKSIVMENMRNL